MVDPIISMKQLTKVLMDGGNGLNTMYAKTLDAMGIDRSHIRPITHPTDQGTFPWHRARKAGHATWVD